MILTTISRTNNVARRQLTCRPRRRLATHAPDFRIPVIDFSHYQRSSSSGQKQETAGAIVGAFKGAGFVYLSNHGIPEPVIKNVYSKVRSFP